MVSKYVKGLMHAYSLVRGPALVWDRNIILLKLVEFSIHQLTLRMVILVAMTSAQRVNELQTVMVEQLYFWFHKDTVILKPHDKFPR